VSLVLDGSATLAWLYPDEMTGPITAVFDLVIHDGAIVPYLWKIEIANSLTMGVRRSRITAKERNIALASLNEMNIVTDHQTDDPIWDQTLSLADRYNLTVYDATYLELAKRLSLPLATLDRQLRTAAQAESVPLLGL
jgi:predicted nucleic acid-binding protein